MNPAFSNPYAIPGATFRPPFEEVTEPVVMTDPANSGETRVYRIDRAASPREVDLSSQQQDPKPTPPASWIPGVDPYAIGGGFNEFLDNQAGG